MTAQVVFWLLAAIDGHAKNFSVFLTPGGYKLTPLYDVMSASPYPQLLPHKIKLAMAVGKNRHYRIMDIQPRHFYQTGQAAGLGKQDMDGYLFRPACPDRGGSCRSRGACRQGGCA